MGCFYSANRLAFSVDSSKWDDMSMKWVVPEHSRGRVDAAGAVIVNTDEPPPEVLNHAIDVVTNWRSSHAYPLQTLKMTLLHRAKSQDKEALVAQRLKRLSSIARKLLGQKNMKLSQMQDLGGCRAVVRTVAQLNRLVQAYEMSTAKNPNERAELVKKFDYIAEPKSDGYRSIHLVYKYRSRVPKHSVYNGHRIEIQMRSRLQHAWATAVETVDICTGQALKSSIGNPSWKRFFLLVSNAIALEERCPLVPGTPTDASKLMREIKALVQQLKIFTVLGGVAQGVHLTKKVDRGDSYLVVLDSRAKMVQVTSYSSRELKKASIDYMNIERDSIKKPEIEAVLISVDSVRKLRSAYPNFYLDTRKFVAFVKRFIS
jgi:hypothetical protein